MAILGRVISQIESTLQNRLAYVLMQNYVEFGEFSNDFLTFLRITNESHPLLLHIFHNKINKVV